MAYVGNSPTQQSFTGGVDQYNGNNSNTVFGLTRTINTVYDVDVYVENVWQRPTTGYTISANTITFTSAPPAGSNNVVVVYKNFSATSIVPQQGSVVHTAFAANAIPTALGYVPANKAGDTFSGAVSGITTLAAGNTTITGFANVTTTLAAGNTTITGTLSASANVNFDSGTLFVDGTNNRVGINNTAPTHVFEVIGGTNNDTMRLNVVGGGSTTLRIDTVNDNAANRNWAFRNRYNAYGRFELMRGTTSTENPLTPVMWWNNDSSATMAANVAINGTIIATGGQIQFPSSQNASSNANTLDDYEEGTWTPNVYNESSSSTWAAKSGRYVKIGGIVHCWFVCDAGNSGTGGSQLKISGLPFSSSSDNLSYGTCGIASTNDGSRYDCNVFQAQSSNVFDIRFGGQNYATQQTYISGFFSYRVT